MEITYLRTAGTVFAAVVLKQSLGATPAVGTPSTGSIPTGYQRLIEQLPEPRLPLRDVAMRLNDERPSTVCCGVLR